MKNIGKRLISFTLTAALLASMLALSSVGANAAIPAVLTDFDRIDFAVIQNEGTFYANSGVTDSPNNFFRYVGETNRSTSAFNAEPYEFGPALGATYSPGYWGGTGYSTQRDVPLPVRPDYIFVGWKVTIAGAQTVVNASNTIGSDIAAVNIPPTALPNSPQDRFSTNILPKLSGVRLFKSDEFNNRTAAAIVGVVIGDPSWPQDYNPSEVTTIGGPPAVRNLRFIAQWTDATYAIVYDAGAGNKIAGTSNETVERTAVYEEKYADATGGTPAIPSADKAGHTFKGWNTKADGTGDYIGANTEVPLLSSPTTVGEPHQTLYAIYEQTSSGGHTNYNYTIKYDAGAGNQIVGTDSQNVTRNVTYGAKYSDAVGGIPAAVKEGYTFVGWNTEPDGTGASLSAATLVPLLTGSAPQQTFYAIYVKEDKKFSFLSGVLGGSVDVPGWVLPLLGLGGGAIGLGALGLIGTVLAAFVSAGMAALLALPLFAFAPEIKAFILGLCDRTATDREDCDDVTPGKDEGNKDTVADDGAVKTPKTGDSNTAILGVLVLLAASGGAAVWLGRKRREEENA